VAAVSGVRMVDISGKPVSLRVAVAEGKIRLRRSTVEAIASGRVEKGDVASVAELGGIIGVKKTPELLPLCHPIPIEGVDIKFRVVNDGVVVRAEVRARSRTGVEMEALTAVATSLLNVWDMVKKYEKDEEGQYPYTQIEYVRVLRKVKT